MQLVEQHIITQGDPRWAELDRVCWYSKNVYNAALYRIRRYFFDTGDYLNYHTVEKHFKKANLLPDQDLPINTVQQTLMQVDTNFKSFFAALKAYRNHPERFSGTPRIPKYKDPKNGRNIAIYTRNSMSKPALKGGILKLTGLNLEIHTQVDTAAINQVRIVPHKAYYTIEVVYTVQEQKEEEKVELDNSNILGIDLGVDNLATLTSNQPGFVPLLVNGRTLKSINQGYNKHLAWLLAQLKPEQHTSKRIQDITFKRNQRVQHYLHIISKRIIEAMVINNIGVLVIGKNDDWKQEVELGKRNNQNFVDIPHTRFIEMLQYKAARYGIEVLVTEESYTSKCSFMDLEPVRKHEVYAGSRVRRAEFVAGSGQRIHADVNGSYNIIRKVFPNAFDASGIEASAVVPVRVNTRMN